MKKNKAIIMVFLVTYLLSMGNVVFAQNTGIDPVLNESTFHNDPESNLGQFDYVTNLLWYSPIGNGIMHVNSDVGVRPRPNGGTGSREHHGTDYRAYLAPLYAPMGGKIYFGTPSNGAKYIFIDHGNGFYTCCRHVKEMQEGLHDGDTVIAGQLIGTSGWSGLSGPNIAHLHFEMGYWKKGGGAKHSTYYAGIWGGTNKFGTDEWITLNPAKQNYTTDKNLVGDYSNAANTLEFRDISYPATYKINNNGWYQAGGIIVSDSKIVKVTSQIVHVNFYNEEGIFITEDPISTTVTPYKPNAKLFSVYKLDNDSKEDNGVKFSKIKDEGSYEWRLTAIDEKGNELTLKMPFKAVKKGETSLNKKSLALDPEASSFTKYTVIENWNNQYFYIYNGDGDLKEYPYAASKTLKTLKVKGSISKLSNDDVFEVIKVVENKYEKDDPGNHLWCEVRQLRDGTRKYFKYFGHLRYLYRKVNDCYFPFICEQDDIKILPFAEAQNYLENTKGRKLYAVAQYENSYGNTWYGVADFDDADRKEIGFVNINNINTDNSFGNAYIDQLIDSRTKEPLYPSGTLEYGKSKTIGGVIHTKEPIYEVRVEVYSQTKSQVQTSASCFPSETTKEININSYVNGKNINYLLKFGKLDVDYYLYRIWVVFGRKVDGVPHIEGSEKLFEKEFQVGNPSEPKPQEDIDNSSGIIAWLKDLFSFTVYAQEDPSGKLSTTTITWLNEDGSVFDSTEEKLGTIPIHEPPVKANTDGKNYVFSGWTPDIGTAFGPATYTAVFSESANSFTITWKNDDNTIIDTTQVEYGKVPTHIEPQKAGTTQTGYVFARWTPKIAVVTGNAEYKATFTPYTRWYAVTWKNADGTILKTDVLDYGTLPAYTGETPTIPDTDGYTYTVKGWTPAISPVTGDITYTAEYDAVAKEPPVTDNPEETPTATVEPSPTPTPGESAYYTYSGSGQNYVKDSGEDKQFSVKRSEDDDKTFSLFRGIQTDGVDVDASNYEASKGSVVIKLKASYLETLAVGDHVLTILFEDGKDDIPFTVSAKSSDPTIFANVAVPSDSFTFKKVWQGDSEKSIDFTLYKADGTVYHHGFDKRVVSDREWRYNAWFSAPAACYVIEKPIPGYQTKYVNVGVYAQITDRCCDGGTIINKKIPKTGDTADLALWAGLMLVGIAGLTTLVLVKKRRKAGK